MNNLKFNFPYKVILHDFTFNLRFPFFLYNKLEFYRISIYTGEYKGFRKSKIDILILWLPKALAHNTPVNYLFRFIWIASSDLFSSQCFLSIRENSWTLCINSNNFLQVFRYKNGSVGFGYGNLWLFFF